MSGCEFGHFQPYFNREREEVAKGHMILVRTKKLPSHVQDEGYQLNCNYETNAGFSLVMAIMGAFEAGAVAQ